jgi:hypothetical protein
MAAGEDGPFNNFTGWQAYRWQMEQAHCMEMAPSVGDPVAAPDA